MCIGIDHSCHTHGHEWMHRIMIQTLKIITNKEEYEPNHMTKERREQFVAARIKEYGVIKNFETRTFGNAVCPICADNFVKNNPMQKYCNTACGSVANVERVKLRRAAS